MSEQTEIRERLGEASAMRLERLADASEEIAHAFELLNQPAVLREVVLSAERPVWRDDMAHAVPAAAFGIVNPSSVEVRVGVGGISTLDTARAPSVPAEGSLIFPVSAGELEIGADPAALAADPAVLYLLRYACAPVGGLELSI